MARKFSSGLDFLTEVCKILKLEKPVRSLTIRTSVEDAVTIEAEFFATVDELSEIKETMKRHIYPQSPAKKGPKCLRCGTTMLIAEVDSTKNTWRCPECGDQWAIDFRARENNA